MSIKETIEREPSPFAAALRRFRTARRLSQLDLANASDVSSRHLSFLESGRAQPSREMVLQLGAGLLLPLHARNALLQAAGFTPVFPASPLDSETLRPFRDILNEMIERHAPNPAMLVDRHWTVLEANAAARVLLASLGGDSGETNVVRMLTRNAAAPANNRELPRGARRTTHAHANGSARSRRRSNLRRVAFLARARLCATPSALGPAPAPSAARPQCTRRSAALSLRHRPFRHERRRHHPRPSARALVSSRRPHPPRG